MKYHEKRAYDLRCLAEAVEKSESTVTVPLSLPMAWFLRDLIGLRGGSLLSDINRDNDLMRLNAALGHRTLDGTPDVAGWSKKMVERIPS